VLGDFKCHSSSHITCHMHWSVISDSGIAVGSVGRIGRAYIGNRHGRSGDDRNCCALISKLRIMQFLSSQQYSSPFEHETSNCRTSATSFFHERCQLPLLILLYHSLRNDFFRHLWFSVVHDLVTDHLTCFEVYTALGIKSCLGLVNSIR